MLAQAGSSELPVNEVSSYSITVTYYLFLFTGNHRTWKYSCKYDFLS